MNEQLLNDLDLKIKEKGLSWSPKNIKGTTKILVNIYMTAKLNRILKNDEFDIYFFIK